MRIALLPTAVTVGRLAMQRVCGTSDCGYSSWRRLPTFPSLRGRGSTKSERGLMNRKVILFVGRLARRKGVREFIQHSMVDIVKRVPDVCFVIAGDNPTESLTHHDDVAARFVK